MPFLITHGLTSDTSDPVAAVKNITNSGGLASIADRFSRNIQASGSSKAGDVGSGIDHVVFCAMDSGGTCGAGSPVRIGMRPDTAMRRDVLVAPRDYGGGADRFSKYKNYRDSLEARAGLEVGKSSIHSPLDPKSRQRQLDNYNTGITKGFNSLGDEAQEWAGNAEYNMAHQVRVEDMQVIACRDQPMATEVQKHLDLLLQNGVVSRIPKVVTQDEWKQHVMLK
jgi:hypothetical protein